MKKIPDWMRAVIKYIGPTNPVHIPHIKDAYFEKMMLPIGKKLFTVEAMVTYQRIVSGSKARGIHSWCNSNHLQCSFDIDAAHPKGVRILIWPCMIRFAELMPAEGVCLICGSDVDPEWDTNFCLGCINIRKDTKIKYPSSAPPVTELNLEHENQDSLPF